MKKLKKVNCGVMSNGLTYIANPYKFFEKGLKEIGPNFAVPYLGGKRANLFSESQYVEEIFKADPKIVLSGKANQLISNVVGKNSLIVLDGDDHKKEKSLLTPSFVGERMRVYNQTIEESVIEIVDEKIKANNTITLYDILEDSTIDIILKTIFGAKKEDYLDDFKSIFKELKSMANPLTSIALFFPLFQVNLGPLTPYAKYARLKAKVDEMIYNLIEQKKDNTSDHDVLSVLLKERYEDGESQSALKVRDQLLTLLVAGQDTTNHSLAWVFTWLFNYPDKLKKLREILDSYSDVENAAKDKYLEAVIKEAIRIYPIFSTVNRVVQEDFIIGEKYLIPKGEYLTAFVYGAHHNEDIFPNSFEFNPERFIERKFTNFEYFPFGGGRRRCIGQAFSMNEMKITVATLLMNFDLKPTSICKPIAYRQGVGMRPKGDIILKISKR